jgi:hypothetical protein
VRASALLGLSRAEVEAALPRLRGEPAPIGDRAADR